MIHSRVMRARLRSYHDGSLQAEAQAAVAQHMAGCAACVRELERLQSADRLLSRTRPTVPTLTPAVAQELFSAAMAASGISSPRRFRSGWQLVGAAMLLVAGIGSNAMRQNVNVQSPRVAAIHSVELRDNPPLQPVRTSRQNVLVKPRLAQTTRQRPARNRLRYRQLFARRIRTVPAGGPQKRLADSVLVSPDPTGAVAAYSEVPARRDPSPFLMVLVSRQTTALSVKVSQATLQTPGFARAESITMNPTGGQIVTRATITTCAAPSDAPESEPEAQPGPEKGPCEPCDWEERNDVE